MTTTRTIALSVLISSLQILSIHGGSEQLLDAWKKVSTNYGNEIQQGNSIYNEISKEQQALDELRTIVERHLRSKNAEILVNAINSNDHSKCSEKLREVIKNITDTYSLQIVDGIFAEAIDEIILIKKLPQLPDKLWCIYENNDSNSFENMLRLQVQLYWRFSGKHYNDEKEFLQNYAYVLYKIQEEPIYNSAKLSLKSNVQNIINKLPDNLKFLYFAPFFCLRNVKYEKYIYTAIENKVDPVSRYIWLWHDSRSMDDTGYIKAQVTENVLNKERKFNVALKSTKYRMYYYMMESTKKIAGWDTRNSTPINYIWDLEFLDNKRVIFSQNDYLMCAVELHDNERRNVGGRKKDQVSPDSPECQWFLGACIFN